METLLLIISEYLAEILAIIIAPFLIYLAREFVLELRGRNNLDWDRWGADQDRGALRDAIAYAEEQDRKARKAGKGLTMEEKLQVALKYYLDDGNRRRTTALWNPDMAEKMIESLLNQSR